MITTDFEKYCENCPELEPEADMQSIKYINTEQITNTVIRCKHRQRCVAIRKSIQKDAMK